MEVPNTPENAAKCICSTCPTYIQGDSGFFCALGKSERNPTQKGCLCGDCALWGEYDLSDGYFCTEGKAS
ncbi:MAG: DUF2769 domain-containing protein [Actinobacteria bacterium]|nr:DUF2769 domain-containing protein [Actinomycetota bacterium]MCL5882928.1 DUF2769 domain-containing protein [Actinomycetota bacterium]